MLEYIGNILSEINTGVVIVDDGREIFYINEKVITAFSLEGKKQLDGSLVEQLNESQTIIGVDKREYIVKKTNFEFKNLRYNLFVLNQRDNTNENLFRLKAYEQIIDKLNEGVLVTNEKDEIIIINSSMENFDNINRENVINKSISEVYNLDHPKYSEHKKVYETSQPLLEQYTAHNQKGGIPQHVSYNTYPLLDNDKTIGAFSIGNNETRLKEMLHETIELKRKLFHKEEKEKEIDNGTTFNFENIKGKSIELTSLIKEAQHIALHKTDVLIVGETGTGKELFAQSIHNYSVNSAHPFVAINCSAIPENLLETTLFGSVKGAFTGAENRQGLFQYAGKGTLFLDEINSMPISLQSKLLRVLEERKVRKLGTNEVYPIDCKVISASNEDPQLLIQDNRLRTDVYYRIAKYVLFIPPLRERRVDIEYYMEHFLRKYNDIHHKNSKNFDYYLKKELLSYAWLGNVRELEHVIENIVLRSKKEDEVLRISHMPLYLMKIMNIQTEESVNNKNKKNLSIEVIQQTLKETNNNVSEAARSLGVSRQNLQYHIKKMKEDM